MSKSVILVDDDPVIRLLVSEYLKTMGYNVSAFDNGNECLKNISSENPDILIFDLQMPDMTGLELLEKVRAIDSISGVPALMLSANEDTKALTSNSTAKPNAFIQKPFQMKELLSIVESLVK